MASEEMSFENFDDGWMDRLMAAYTIRSPKSLLKNVTFQILNFIVVS